MKKLINISKRTDLSLDWQKLNKSFYQRNDVLKIAKELIGKVLVTCFDNTITAGRIVETEAYNGVIDMASHAYNNKRTQRTEIMYASGGVGYVYLCYGIHHLFNVVTNIENIPDAVLIRAIEPMVGQEQMLLRARKSIIDNTITKGPGNLSRALGIYKMHSGIDLAGSDIFVADDGYVPDLREIKITPRIGVDYAGEDAFLPYRFLLNGSPFVSGKNKNR